MNDRHSCLNLYPCVIKSNQSINQSLSLSLLHTHTHARTHAHTHAHTHSLTHLHTQRNATQHTTQHTHMMQTNTDTGGGTYIATISADLLNIYPAPFINEFTNIHGVITFNSLPDTWLHTQHFINRQSDMKIGSPKGLDRQDTEVNRKFCYL